MTSADLKDLMLGAAVAVGAYMLYQHFKAKKKAQTDAQLDASVPQEIRQWDDPAFVQSQMSGLDRLLQGVVGDLIIPVTYPGQ